MFGARERKIFMVRWEISKLPPKTQAAIKNYEAYIDEKLQGPDALDVDGFKLFESYQDAPSAPVLKALARLYEAGGYVVKWRSSHGDTNKPQNIMCLEYASDT